MKNFTDNFMNTKLQPQIFSLVFVTIILVVLSIVIYTKTKKQQSNKAPEGFMLLAEQYVMGIDNLYKEITEEKLAKPGPYIFTLITFLLVSNLTGLIGINPPTTSYSVTLIIGLISWIGIYVVGLLYQKMHFFKKYLNPIEILSQFSPLISLSFRLFGNMIAGSTVLYLFYYFSSWAWGHVPVIGEFNILGPIIVPLLHGYFDIFDGLVQAFVFSLLTMIYWTLEAEEPEIKDKVKKTKAKKAKAYRKEIKRKNKIARA
ncbi:F0F1 ATP synthase subunit A [Candidatus Mycoplasma mahonii]|uniref:F0F1 ATP synthase subunit A n=1 Tax=Candidatus Mycoplasma mahonii TaxID=3004105 RepID=UPI0026EA2C2C|nr:F0F1 ATP synthase subunit A [Candidatus Mycoplasma mahonii]WKX02817.1 F0F1 ATP synthase subunit A [Candidatus Mycoplasma mahonii]